MEIFGLVTGIWTELLTWLSSSFSSVSLFFVSGTGTETDPYKLTFPGVFAVVMAGVALILLIFNLIRSFLPMRG